MGTRMGGAITPPLVVALMTTFGWRRTFFMFGALGLVWAWFWWRWFRDEPSQHPDVNAAELAQIEYSDEPKEAAPAFKWSELLTPNLLLVYGMYFTMGYTLYFNLTWLPTYLKDVRGFTLQEAGWLSGVVLFTGGVMTYVGGKLTDALVKKYGLKIGRSMGVVTLPIAGLLLFKSAVADDVPVGVTLRTSLPTVPAIRILECRRDTQPQSDPHLGGLRRKARPTVLEAFLDAAPIRKDASMRRVSSHGRARGDWV
jgi:sugar phosphate permease